MPQNYDLCFKTPQKRWIFIPTKTCRLEGKVFVKTILKKWAPPDYFYHFQSGGHIAAISIHVNNCYFAKIDIHKFFPSISKNRIIRVLKSIGLSYKHSLMIAEWSVVVSKEDSTKRVLPYGFVQSQLLASLCMDKSAIGTFIKNIFPSSIPISIYVDDFIISSNDKSELLEIYDNLVSAVKEAGFFLNDGKSHPPQLNSTAFNINLSQNKTVITKSRFNEFLENISLEEKKRTEAIINYVKCVNSTQGQELTQKLQTLQTN